MTIAVRLSENLEKRLNDLAKETHRTKTYYIQQAVEDFLEEYEDYYLATYCWEEFQKNGKKGISLEEIERKMGIESE